MTLYSKTGSISSYSYNPDSFKFVVNPGDTLFFLANSNLTQGCDPLGCFEVKLNGISLHSYSSQTSCCHTFAMIADTGNFDFKACSNISHIMNVKISYATALGVEEVEKLQARVFPNPAQTFIFIKSETDIIDLKVQNLAGQVMFESNPRGNDFPIDLSSLNQGYYLIRLRDEKGREFIQKLIK